MESTFRPVLSLMTGRALAFAATFFIPVVLARVFDQSQFGTYKQAFLIYTTLYFVAQFGMAQSLFYFLPSAPRQGGRYVVNALLVLGAAGLAGLTLLATFGAQASSWLSNRDLSDLTTLLGVYLLLMLVSTVLEIVMITRKRYFWASCSYGLSDVLRAFCFIIPAALVHRLDWLLLGAVAFASLRAGATLFYLRREFGGELRPDGALARQQLAYAGPFGLAVLLEIVQTNFHQYAVANQFDAATFAIYAVGCLDLPVVDFFLSPAAGVMMVRMREEITEGRRRAATAIWHDTTRKLALILFPLAGLLLVSARDLIVLLFTATYLASVPIAMVWSTTNVLTAVLTDSVLRVYAQTRVLLLLNTLRVLLIVALIGPFLLAFGLTGAALATIVAQAVTKGVALGRMTTLMRTGWTGVLPWPRLGAILAAAAGATAAALIVRSQLDLPPLPLLGTTGLVYTATYLALVFRFGLLTEGERLALKGWLRSPLRPRPELGELRSRGNGL